jgi:hypothetical protein
MGAYWESKEFRIAAFVLPVLALFAVLANKAQLGSQDTVELTVPIEGFDPRDLLAGHYLTYGIRASRLDMSAEATQTAEKQSFCACFSEQEVFITQCANHKCKLYVPITSRNGLLFTSDTLERYYFPDKYKDVLAVVPVGSKMKIAVNAGNAKALQMYVYSPEKNTDLTVEDWASLEQIKKTDKAR